MDRPELVFQGESEFVKDEFYEDFEAPKFYDFCLHHSSIEADTWFSVTSSQAGSLNIPLEVFEEETRLEQEAVTQEASASGRDSSAPQSGAQEVSVAAPTDDLQHESLSDLFDKLLLIPKNEPKSCDISDPTPETVILSPPQQQIMVAEPETSANPMVAKGGKKENRKIKVAKQAENVVPNQVKQPQIGRKRKITKTMGCSAQHNVGSNTANKVKEENKGATHKASSQTSSEFPSQSSSFFKLHQGCFVSQHKKLKTTCPQPFRLLTEERGALKELQFNKKVEQYIATQDNIPVPSSFSSLINCTPWGGGKSSKAANKDLSKFQKQFPEQLQSDTRAAELIERVKRDQRTTQENDKLQPEKPIQQQAKQEKVVLQEREAFKEIQLNKKVESKGTDNRKWGYQVDRKETQLERTSQQMVEERGALKEIKCNKKTENFPMFSRGKFFPSIRSLLGGKAPKAAAESQTEIPLPTTEDKLTEILFPLPSNKLATDCPFQPRRSNKKLTVPRAPKFHMTRSKRDCSKTQVEVAAS